MSKKVISILLTLLMVMSLLPMTTLGQDGEVVQSQGGKLVFSDMPQGELGQVLQRAVDNGLLGGMPNGTIAPNDHLTRAQLAAIVNRAFGSSTQADINHFKDMKKNDWHYQDIAKAVKMGILVGENGLMQPNRTITKQEAFAILARAFKLTGGTVADLSAYEDGHLVSAWAKEVVATLVKGGYYTGLNGKLNAQDAISRAEFASVMDKLVSQYIKIAGNYTAEQVISKGNVLINVPGVTLKDLTIAGDLILGDGIGNGDVILDNVKVNGRLVVRGGGENSIRIIGGSNVGTVIVSRVDGVVRVAVSGDASVSVVVVDDGSDDVILEGTIGDIQVEAEAIVVSAVNASITNATVAGAGSTLIVGQDSTIDSVTVAPSAANTNLDIRGTVTTANIQAPQTRSTISGTVNTLNAASTATGSTVNVANNANVGTLSINAAIQVANNGTIRNAEINSNDVILDGNKADNVKVDSSVTEPPKNSSGDVVQPTPPSSGGGGGGGSSTTPVSAISVTGVAKVGETLTATITPSGATASYQWMRSDSEDKDGTYTNISGATEKTYKLVAADVGKYIKVKATGTGDYRGTVESEPMGPVEAAEEAPVEEVTRTAAPTQDPGNTGGDLEYNFADGTLTISGTIADIPESTNPANVTAKWIGVNIPKPAAEVADEGNIHLTIKEDGKDDVVHESVSYGEGDPFLYYFGAKENGRTQTLEIVWNGTHKETLVIKYVDTTPVVAPTITLDGVPTSDVTTEIKATEDANGLVTGFDTTDRTPIQVTLTKGSADYSNVRVVVEGVSDGIQLIAQDTAGNWYNIVKAGWGSSDGFALENATTPVYLVANTAGTYTATIKLVDVSNSNAELATATASVTAVQQ